MRRYPIGVPKLKRDLKIPFNISGQKILFFVLILLKNYILTVSQYVRIPIESCPDNFSLENGICIHKIETQKIPVCPEGFVSKDTECYSAEPLLKECPTGFLMQDKQCVREIFAEREITCPSGLEFDLITNKCFYNEDIKAICPPGSINFKESCAIIKEPIRICKDPLEFDSNSDLCIERNVTLPIAVCPNSFVFDIEIGMCVKEKPEEKICPEGFLSTDDNRCAKWIEPEYSCPNGSDIETINNNIFCRLTKYLNSSLICPNGTQLEGQLCISDKLLHEKVCPPGFIEFEDQCVNYKDPIFNCPEGFEEFIHNGNKVCLNTLVVEPEIICPTINSFFENFEKLCISESIIDKECPNDSFLHNNSCVKKIQHQWECPPGSKYDSSIHSCIEMLNIEPTIICPSNTRFEEINSICIGYDRNIQVCPSGYEEIGENECASFIPPKRSCPNDLNLVDGQCEEIITLKPEIICPFGTELINSTCIAKSESETKKKCPINSLDSGDYCSIYEDPEKTCLDGYIYDKKIEKCTKMSVRPAEIICKEPSLPNLNGECINTEILPKVCPSGFKEDTTNDHFCSKENKADKVCPENYELENNQCIKELKTELVLKCPVDYKLSEIDNNCHKIQKRNQICPPGFLDNGEECFKTRKPIYECPKEFVRESKFGDCIKMEIIDTLIQCPENSIEKDSFCITKKPLPINYKCLEGSKIGDSCLVETFTTVSYECPTGYLLSEIKQCQRLVEYDCSEVSIIPISCQSNESRNIGVLNYNQNRNGVCSQVVRTPKSCTRTESFPPKISCPLGTLNIGKECLKKEYTPMNKVCSDPSKTLKNCFEEVIFPKINACPANYNITEDNKCVLLIRKTPNLICEEGYTMQEGICIQKTNKLCPPEGCISKDIIESIKYCPDGYILENGICIFKQILKPIHVCQKGVLLNPDKNICLEKIPKICNNNNCEIIYKHEPELKCHSDETLNIQTKQCERINIGPQTLKCEKPFKLFGDKCIHKVPKECSTDNCSISISIPPRSTCIQGTLVSNNKCEVIKRIPCNLNCPKEFILKNDICVKYIFKECLNNQCEKKVNYPPIIECPNQYSLFPNGNCVKKIYHIPQIKCPQGSNFLNSYCVKEIDPICPNENCIIKQTFSPILKCPYGFQKNIHNFKFGGPVCTKKLFHNGQLTCPNNYILSNGNCIIYSEKKCNQDNCDQLLTLNPEETCPNGTELVNHLCKESQIIPKQMYCPSDIYSLEGDKCILYEKKLCHTKNCKLQEFIEPQVACPQGFHLDQAICLTEKYHPSIYTCPQNSQMINGKCFFITKKECPDSSCQKKVLIDPISICPKGFVDIDNKCILLEYSGHKKMCPKGMLMKKNHCLKFTKPKFQCPQVSLNYNLFNHFNQNIF